MSRMSIPDGLSSSARRNIRLQGSDSASSPFGNNNSTRTSDLGGKDCDVLENARTCELRVNVEQSLHSKSKSNLNLLSVFAMNAPIFNGSLDRQFKTHVSFENVPGKISTTYYQKPFIKSELIG